MNNKNDCPTQVEERTKHDFSNWQVAPEPKSLTVELKVVRRFLVPPLDELLEERYRGTLAARIQAHHDSLTLGAFTAHFFADDNSIEQNQMNTSLTQSDLTRMFERYGYGSCSPSRNWITSRWINPNDP